MAVPFSLLSTASARSFTRLLLRPMNPPPTKRSSSSSALDDEQGGAPKKAKLFPMFAPKGSSSSGGPPKGSWLKTPPSLLHYISPSLALPPISGALRKVAFFDLDGTLIKPRQGRKWPRDEHDWEWWNPKVRGKVEGAYKNGWEIVLITNQNGLKTPTPQNANKHRNWKNKIEHIANATPDVQFQVFAALEKDHFRKPMTGMYDYFEELGGGKIDITSSYYVGDAAGRPARVGFAKDHGDGDRKWADNLGLRFFTPEIFFDVLPTEVLPPFVGFRPRDLTPGPLYTPSSTPFIPSPLPFSEIVLFVGSPGAGKSHFFRTFFDKAGYARVNQDELGTRQKCLAKVEEIVKKAAKGEGEASGRVVVDNTNRNLETRAPYIAIAKAHSIPIRCILFPPPSHPPTPTSILTSALFAHNNLYRLYPSASGSFVPQVALSSFRTGYEEPVKEEGFDEEVKRVGVQSGWIGVEGEDKERRRWEGWMS